MANIQHQFESLGFGYDNYTFMGYNNINGFYFTVYAVPGYKVYNISVYFILPDEEAERCFNHALKQFLQQKNKIIRSAKYENRKLTFYCKSGGIALEITDGVKEVTGACMDLFNQFRKLSAAEVADSIKAAYVEAGEGLDESIVNTAYENAMKQVAMA